MRKVESKQASTSSQFLILLFWNKLETDLISVNGAGNKTCVMLYQSHDKCVCFSSRAVDMKKKAVERISEQLMKLEVQATDREENKQIALGTSKLNYLDPRISVAW